MKYVILLILLLIFLFCKCRENFMLMEEEIIPKNWPKVVDTDDWRPYYYVDPTIGNRLIYDWRWN